MFYKSTTREQYFTHDDDNYKHFHSTITWRDPYEYIWPTNLLINIFKQNINSIKDLLAKHYKLILEKNGADKRDNNETKRLLIHAYYNAKKLGLSDVIKILEEHCESEKIDFRHN